MRVTPAETATDARPWKSALGWLCVLGPFFFATYGLANWAASLRAQVPAVVFDWERHIPFLPWTIVPYWAIDLLYGLSLFLLPNRAALLVHVRRLLAAQVFAVACFLALPLRFSFDRPEVSGAYAWMYAALDSFDQPFNQAPSLHIALIVILWQVYLRAVPRTMHLLLHAGFLLIGISVLTTWQHHFIDIPTGAWLGWFCIWLFPDNRRSPLAAAALTCDPMRRKLAWRYGASAVAVGALSLLAGGAWLWFAWISGALALVAFIYAAGEPADFGKRSDGSIASAAWWLMGPYFVGAWLNSRWWTRNTAAADAVAPDVFLGRLPSGVEIERAGVASVVDLSAELPCAAGTASYVNVPILDLTAPSVEQIERAVFSIEAMRARGPVLVCCALGYARSAAAVAAWLTHTRTVPDLETAVVRVRRARPAVVLIPAYLDALRAWRARSAG